MNTTSRRREQVIGLALPVAILVISLAVMFWALSDLPDPVAGWSPERSKLLAHACLATLDQML